MFTAWELIYSQLQHRQSLPLPRNARTPHSISLYATALRIQYQISSTPSERKDSNLQSGSRCCFPCIRHFYQLSYVPKPPSDGQQSYLSCHALHYPCAFMENRWVRIRTSQNQFLKRCCCWLRVIVRLSLGNTLTDRLLCLHYHSATTYAHFMSARAVQGNQSLSFDCLQFHPPALKIDALFTRVC